MNIINRREIFATFSHEAYLKVRDLLQKSGIKMHTKFVNRIDTSVYRSGRLTLEIPNQQVNNEYIIYVHKNDMARAQYVLYDKGLQKMR